jgi:hypothetical protein
LSEPVWCMACQHGWDRDPVLEVPCPVCGQKIGSKCVSRAPSGHVKTAAFSGLPAWGHDMRDLLADRCGAYAHTCPKEADEDPLLTAEQGELF